MIDEIDYFPKRDKHKKKKGIDEDWKALKKTKSAQDKKPPPPEKKSAKDGKGKKGEVL